MEILSVQNCISTQPYFMKRVLSASQPGQVYDVTVITPGDPSNRFICTCKGFEFTGHCRHQLAILPICGWQASDGPEEQTDEQWEKHTCPRCGNYTEEGLIYDEDA
jgi:uncharacterized Zn finger protein